MAEATLSIPDLVPEILDHWQILADREPWRRLPSGDHQAQLAELLHPLLRAAVGDDGDARWHAAYTRLATELGRRRRTERVAREALFSDFNLLRHAVWAALRDRMDGGSATTAILRVDVAISVCIRGALVGFYHEELDGSGRWDELVEQVVRESPLWPG